MAGQRVRLSTLTSERVEVVPGQSDRTVVAVRPSQIAPTPVNTRDNFGTPEELAELGESLRVRQLQAVVVVHRDRYVALWPEHAEMVTGAEFVLVCGERRWRAATQVSLPTLDADVRDDLTQSRAGFLEAVTEENLGRANLDPIEEARAVDSMVVECGSAAAAAEQFRRSEGWVSQRRALLKLTKPLQQQVQAGQLAVRTARTIAALPPEEQEAAVADVQARESGRARARRERPAAGDAPGQGDQSTGSAGSNGSAGKPADRKQSGLVIHYKTPAQLAQFIREKLSDEDQAELVQLLQV
jgi:ParB family chromosome partitioning protein